MADALARRGFLRGLAHLPLIGGVTILGNPTKAAEPVTEELLGNYREWLQMELRFLSWEVGPQTPERFEANVAGAMRFRSDTPAGRFHSPDTPPPSRRAAVVLSAVGCGWREGPFTGR